MSLLDWSVVLVLAPLGAAWHILCARQRAWFAVRARVGLASLLFPLGLLGPAAAVIASASISKTTTWVMAALLLLSHRVFVLRLQRDPSSTSAEGSEVSP